MNRLFPWRSSSGAGQRSSSGSRMLAGVLQKESSSQLFSGSSTSSVRRTSPVDLNLGGEPSTTSPILAGPPPMLVSPSTLAIPRFPKIIEPEPTPMSSSATILPSHLRRSRRQREGGPPPPTHVRMTPAPAESLTYRSPTPEQIDREELSALRHLASELHSALRMSEEENLLLKGNIIYTTHF